MSNYSKPPNVCILFHGLTALSPCFLSNMLISIHLGAQSKLFINKSEGDVIVIGLVKEVSLIK